MAERKNKNIKKNIINRIVKKMIEKDKLIAINFILLLFVLSPYYVHATENTLSKNTHPDITTDYSTNNYENSLDNIILKSEKKENLTLENAEIYLMMRTRGTLVSSHVIHNFNDEDVYIITIKENGILKTYLIEQDSTIKLVETEKEKI